MCEQLKNIRARVDKAALRAGRDPGEIKILAVSKKKPAGMVRDLFNCGQSSFGENYVQEAVAKIQELSDIRGQIQWHFIGHLQRNKSRLAAEYFDLVETLDSFRLAKALDRQAQELGRMIDCLVQVNIGRDPAKSGVEPEELGDLLGEVSSLSSLRVRGLMTIHPWSASSQEARRWFRELRLLRDKTLSRGLPEGMRLDELSMGMSRDFEEAVEEGATIVRIGTALFGPRD